MDLDITERAEEREAEILRVLRVHEKAKTKDNDIMKALNTFDTASNISSPSTKWSTRRAIDRTQTFTSGVLVTETFTRK